MKLKAPNMVKEVEMFTWSRLSCNLFGIDHSQCKRLTKTLEQVVVIEMWLHHLQVAEVVELTGVIPKVKAMECRDEVLQLDKGIVEEGAGVVGVVGEH
jgi:hypothetical protein